MDENAFDEMMKELYNKGYIEVEYDENLNAMLRVTPKGVERAEAFRAQAPKELLDYMDKIIGEAHNG